jgi:hypothetical protein
MRNRVLGQYFLRISEVFRGLTVLLGEIIRERKVESRQVRLSTGTIGEALRESQSECVGMRILPDG